MCISVEALEACCVVSFSADLLGCRDSSAVVGKSFEDPFGRIVPEDGLGPSFQVAAQDSMSATSSLTLQ
jgi:hypothetical protein